MLRMLPFLVFVVIVFMVALAVTRYFTSKVSVRPAQGCRPAGGGDRAHRCWAGG
jgi:hypothetical protein